LIQSSVMIDYSEHESNMRRREFLCGLGSFALGSAATLPFTAFAQNSEQMRRIGLLMVIAESESEARSDLRAFRHGLSRLGWNVGKNISIDCRWGTGNSERLSADAAQLVNSSDLIVAQGTPGLAAARNASRSIPIVFVNVTDPVAQGFVQSLAHPGGNITGFALFEGSMGAKWLETLKELAPEIKAAALMFNPAMAPYFRMYLRSMESAAPSLAMNPYALPLHEKAHIERAFASVAHDASTGVIVLLDVFTLEHRDLIISNAAEHGVPVVYADRQRRRCGFWS
jgi:ABC-type uncharacterized transport system substrate-binding protein